MEFINNFSDKNINKKSNVQTSETGLGAYCIPTPPAS